MFKTLKERGLQGVQLITTDAHCDIQEAVKQEFPGVHGNVVKLIFLATYQMLVLQIL